MEIELQTNNKDTLMHGLTAWSKIENEFRKVFSDESVKDRDYLKMKLAEFNRLHDRHEGRIRTTDDRAFITMLRFQRRKLEKAIYPGILRRMLHRAVVFLSSPIDGSRELEMAKQAVAPPYVYTPLPVREAQIREQPKETLDANQKKETKPGELSGEISPQEKSNASLQQREQVGERNYQWKKTDSWHSIQREFFVSVNAKAGNQKKKMEVMTANYPLKEIV